MLRGQFAKAADAYMAAAAPMLYQALRAALSRDLGWESQAAIALLRAEVNPENMHRE